MGKRDDDDDFGFRTPTKRSRADGDGGKRDTGSAKRPKEERSKRETGSTKRPKEERSKRDTGAAKRPEGSKRDTGSTKRPEGSKRDTGSTKRPEAAKGDTGRTARPKTGKQPAVAAASPPGGGRKALPLVAGLSVAAVIGVGAVILLNMTPKTADPIRETARIRPEQPELPPQPEQPPPVEVRPIEVKPVAPPPRPLQPVAPEAPDEEPAEEVSQDVKDLLAQFAGRSPTHAEVARILEELNEVFDPAALRDPGPGFERFLERRKREEELLERVRGMGPLAIEALSEMLLGLDHRQYQLFLGKALAGIEGPEALAAVQNILGQVKDVSLQTTMIRHLPDSPDAADLVGAAMQGEKDANLRAMLLREYHQRLGEDQARGAEVFRAAALDDPDPNVRAEAVTILGRRADPNDQQLLQDIVAKETNLSIRQRAIVALGETGKEASLPFLEDLSRDTNASLNVRASAVLAIGKVGGDQAIRSLDLLAQTDPSEEIRSRAQRLAQSLRRAAERAAAGDDDDTVEPGPVQIGPGAAPLEKN